MKQLFIAVLGALLLPVAAQAQFTYTTNNSTITITSYTGTGGNVMIPAMIGVYPVVTIGDQAFANSYSVTNIIIPTSISTLGYEAFAGCTGLTSITLPNNITYLGGETFFNCTSLTNILVAADNPTFSSAGGVWFDKIQTTLIEYPEGLAGTYVLPNSVTSLGGYAFAGCSGLTSITIPNHVTSLGNFAFYDCLHLTNVLFQGNAPSLGTLVFFDVGSATTVYYVNGATGWSATYGGLPTVTLPFNCTINNENTVTIIGYTGAGGAVAIPDTLCNLPVTTIGDGVFDGNNSLTSIAIPYRITSIGDEALVACTSLTNIMVSVSNSAYSSLNGVLFDKNQTTLIQYPGGLAGAYYVIPNSVTGIGDEAFLNSSLTGITIPNSVTNLGDEVFYGCFGLTSVTLPNGITGLSLGEFSYCANLTSIGFLGNAPAIDGLYVFLGVNAAAKVYYLNGTTGWGTSYGGGPNAPVDVPNSILPTQVQTSSLFTYTATNGAITITGYTGTGGAVNIPSTLFGLPVTSIAGYAFAGNTSLTSVIIPNTVTNIGDFAFFSCDNLVSFLFQGDAPVPGTGMFAGVNSSAKVYYLVGASGWDTTYGGLPTIRLGSFPVPLMGGAKVGVNGFGFTIDGTNNQVVIVLATTNLAGPNWIPIQTNTLSNTPLLFTDPNWKNYPQRFYRVMNQ